MSLSECPNEIILIIIKDLGPKDLNSLLRTNKRKSNLLTATLHKLALLDKDSMPAICWAAMRGYLPLVHKLIDAKVDINAQEPIGHETALFKAIRGGSKAITDPLLQNGADIKLQNCKGDTVLHLAVIDDDVGLVERLLERGANHRHHNVNGETALYIAAKSGAVAVVKLLFGLLPRKSVECLVGTTYHNGDTALQVAVQEGHEHVAKFLIESQKHDVQDRPCACNDSLGMRGKTILQGAVLSRLYSIVELLLDQGVKVGLYGHWYYSDWESYDFNPHTYANALHMAISTKDISIVKLLVKNGADVNAVDGNGQTPLHWANFYKFDAATTLLLDSGAVTQTSEQNPLDKQEH